MLFHISVPADDPARVAAVIAELWRGESLPFPPIAGAHVAFAGDDRASAIEVYPRETVLEPDADGGGVRARMAPTPAYRGACHAAIASPLSVEAISAIARREGWTCNVQSRGGVFRVVEFWLENAFMLEIMTADMQAEYVARITPANWRKMLEGAAPA